MEIYNKAAPLRKHLQALRQQNLTVGFVPTMGALHQGHLSLISLSKAHNDVTVCSIFVNPTQFNNPEDFEKYPLRFEEDTAKLQEVGCDVVFMPTTAEMYPAQPAISMQFGPLETGMEGAHRPGHFNGVGLVVAKFFNIVQPTQAYFGQKDLQQYLIIKQMAADLAFPVKVIAAPIIREPNGLAMSSRNLRLSPTQRQEASTFYKALLLGKELLLKGQTPHSTTQQVREFVSRQPQIQLEYFQIADRRTLRPVNEKHPLQETVLCIAGYLGDVRLIDNLFLSDENEAL